MSTPRRGSRNTRDWSSSGLHNQLDDQSLEPESVPETPLVRRSRTMRPFRTALTTVSTTLRLITVIALFTGDDDGPEGPE